MGDAKKLSLEKIISINVACGLIGDNEALDATTAYRIAKLAGYTEPHLKAYNKAVDKINKEYKDKSEGKSEEEKASLNEERSKQIRELLEAEAPEEIKIPDLKLSMFSAKKKMKVGDREYEEGQLLVPQKFLTLMGEEIIKE